MNFALLFVGQLALYLLFMLADEYAGTLLAIILGAIALAIWLLSYVVEWIEASRVGRGYYQLVLSAWVSPLAALIVFILLRGGIGWL